MSPPPPPAVFLRHAPAKINLMLAVTGTRPDGFHNIVSLVAPLPALCDTVKMTPCPRAQADSLACSAPGVPCDDSNLALRAVLAFRRRFPAFPHVRIELEKRIPHGAGLGGGSSDAVAALLAANEAAGTPASRELLREIAAGIGSDCPLFLAGTPVVMRGRGEKIEPCTDAEIVAIRAKKFLIFKPPFSVSTAQVYATMKRRAPKFYTSEADAERALDSWNRGVSSASGASIPLFNAMEAPVFEKYPALPALFSILRERFALAPHMSGSGSACFAEISASRADLNEVRACIRSCWGEASFVFLA